MTYSLDKMKAEFTGGQGPAKGNRYKVSLPTIPEIYSGKKSSASTMDILCKSAMLPGRQLLTTDRVIGTTHQHVVYGYANEDVNLSFVGLNDYGVRRYFENWQHYTISKDNNRVKYLTEYAKTVTIHQLDINGNEVYGVKLLQAYPIQVLNVDFSGEANQMIDINVTLTYTKWKAI